MPIPILVRLFKSPQPETPGDHEVVLAKVFSKDPVRQTDTAEILTELVIKSLRDQFPDTADSINRSHAMEDGMSIFADGQAFADETALEKREGYDRLLIQWQVWALEQRILVGGVPPLIMPPFLWSPWPIDCKGLAWNPKLCVNLSPDISKRDIVLGQVHCLASQKDTAIKWLNSYEKAATVFAPHNPKFVIRDTSSSQAKPGWTHYNITCGLMDFPFEANAVMAHLVTSCGVSGWEVDYTY